MPKTTDPGRVRLCAARLVSMVEPEERPPVVAWVPPRRGERGLMLRWLLGVAVEGWAVVLASVAATVLLGRLL